MPAARHLATAPVPAPLSRFPRQQPSTSQPWRLCVQQLVFFSEHRLLCACCLDVPPLSAGSVALLLTAAVLACCLLLCCPHADLHSIHTELQRSSIGYGRFCSCCCISSHFTRTALIRMLTFRPACMPALFGISLPFFAACRLGVVGRVHVVRLCPMGCARGFCLCILPAWCRCFCVAGAVGPHSIVWPAGPCRATRQHACSTHSRVVCLVCWSVERCLLVGAPSHACLHGLRSRLLQEAAPGAPPAAPHRMW